MQYERIGGVVESMQVFELADDLNVSTDALIELLRHMGIPVADDEATITDAQVAKILAKMERERRAGHSDPAEAVRSAMLDAAPSTGRRRRRRRVVEEVEPDTEEVVEKAEESTSETEESIEDTVVAGHSDPVEVEEVDVEESEATEVEEPEATEVEAQEGEHDPSSTEELGEDPVEVGSEMPASEVDTTHADSTPEKVVDPDKENLAPARAGQPDGPVVRTIRRPAPAASAGPGGQVRIQAEGYTPDGRRQRQERGKKGKKKGVDRDAVKDNIARVMAELRGGGKKRRRKGQRVSAEEKEAQEQAQEEKQERERRTVKVNEFLTIAELAELVDVSASEIIGSAFKNLGLMVTINQRLDFDQIELLLDEFNFTAVKEEEYIQEAEVEDDEDDPAMLRPRPPVVTVMGHVDHGKTLLLDRIRSTNVVAGEAGGITQHIGAYHVELEDGRSVAFLDTPGHAAFTAMRARGADVTDIVILIVAADDSVMPQTIEAISHSRNAGVPMIVAINKCDLPAADPMRVKQELLQHSVNIEDFGGDVLAQEISAKEGTGIEDLLDKVLLQAEMLELTANPEREAQGTVIEAQLDPGKGPVATVLVQKGTLRVGDSFVCGLFDGRVRSMLDERGHAVEEASPAIPVQVLGAGGVPQAGDTFQAMSADQASEIASTRQRLDREKQLRVRERGLKLGDFGKLVKAGQLSELPIVIKGDVDGSVQALSDSLEQLGTSEVAVNIVHRGVGAINESDVLLAQTSGAVILGFRVRPQTAARQAAERDDVEINVYDVIYEAVDEITAALEGMLAPDKKETVEGTAEVREVFKVSKVGTIAGCYVSEGRIDRKGHGRLIRDGIVVYDGEISSLKRFKDDAKEVREGFECGIGIANFNDIKVGDIIEAYSVEEVARTLANST
ncbi:MAG: translation initiation factor IF-2 [Gemmatimonadota bacterium]|nr:translation initiation factor IF-2 [Gemmatimonadota bacterium]